MDISIIIVSWNTRQILKDCLQSIRDGIDKPEYEVIVIDNASSDDSAKMVAEEFPEVILIQNQSNRGFAAANNQGMSIARGRYILLLNSDTLLIGDVLRATLDFAMKRPQAAVVGCRVMNPDGSLQPTCFMFPSILNLVLSSTYLYKLLPGNRFFGRERMTWWERNDARQVDVVTGCFMLVRREAIEQVDMMDEQFFMYGEETDWCFRFRKSGWEVWFTPDGQIVHLGGQSSEAVRGAMLVQLRMSILRFFRKHHGWFAYKTAVLLTLLFLIVRVPYWYIKAVFDGDGRKRAMEQAKVYIKGIRSILSSYIKYVVRFQCQTRR